jgi:putative tryptophan/tyrosine transport system substrate-binding protein
MRRREFIAGLGGAAAWPLVVRAQSPGRVARVGVMLGIAENDPEAQARLFAFRRGLAALGWVADKNIRLEYFFGEGNAERTRSIAAELIRRRPDVILANSTSVVSALKELTRDIPIVFAVLNDPVGQGLIESLARPGGNLTGFTFIRATSGHAAAPPRPAMNSRRRILDPYGATHMVFRDGANPTGITAVSFIVAISTTETLFVSGLAT